MLICDSLSLYRLGRFDCLHETNEIRMTNPSENFNLSPNILTFVRIGEFSFAVGLNCEGLAVIAFGSSYNGVASSPDDTAHLIPIDATNNL